MIRLYVKSSTMKERGEERNSSNGNIVNNYCVVGNKAPLYPNTEVD